MKAQSLSVKAIERNCLLRNIFGKAMNWDSNVFEIWLICAWIFHNIFQIGVKFSPAADHFAFF